MLPYATEALVELGQFEEAAAVADELEAAEGILARWHGPALRARALVQAPPIVTAPLRSSMPRSPRTIASEANSKARERCSRVAVFSGGGSADVLHVIHSNRH